MGGDSAYDIVKSILFENVHWEQRLGTKLRPILVGSDLERLCNGQVPDEEIFITVAVPDDEDGEAGDLPEFRDLFLQSLKKHRFLDEKRDEVKFESHNILLNVSSLKGDEEVWVQDLTRLFREQDGGLITKVLYCGQGNGEIETLKSDSIGGLCKTYNIEAPKSKVDVSRVCSVKVRRLDGRLVYQNFSKPDERGQPRIRGILACEAGNRVDLNDEQIIGHGGFIVVGSITRKALIGKESDPATLLDWAGDLRCYNTIPKGVYEHQCWIQDFTALNSRLVSRSILAEKGLTQQSYWTQLNAMQETSIAALAVTLNDSPESLRRMALNLIRDQNQGGYDEVMECLTTLQIMRKELDPKRLFACIATPGFLETLRADAQSCWNCKNKFETGMNMIWSYCDEHATCSNCFAKFDNGGGLHCGVCIPYSRWNRYGYYRSLEDVVQGIVPVVSEEI